MHAAVDAAFDSAEVRAVVDGLVAALDEPGRSNGLATKLLALTIPGVPDVYQGTELWDHSLADPDNRRPVDYDDRVALLADGGHPKLRVTTAALRLRRDRPELFTSYAAVPASGPAADHVLAFDRGGAVTVVTRLPVGLRRAWRLGRHRAGARGDVARRADRPGRDHSPRRRAPRPARRAAGEGRLMTRVLHRSPYDVWAPRAQRVRLSVGDAIVEMTRGDDDWWVPADPVPDTSEEVDYGYLIDDSDTPRPDPRSRRQPAGVHQRSRTFDPTAHVWHDQAWTGRQLGGAVVYELHVGTFTPEGTFDAALGRLDHLRSLGVDLVELMPVNAMSGVHNWGYDGVLWHAVHEPYGGPAGYQRFVDGCHQAGLGVIQDVVYNHLGPSGNYLPEFGPYLKAGRNTWGDLVNLDGEGSAEVRRFILDNVRMWLEDYHVDGLRIDAVHALSDSSDVHLLEEMAIEVAALSAHQRRPLTLIAESDLNDPKLVTPREAGGYGLDGQWSDDFHHAVHVALTGETTGWLADFEPLSALAKVCERGFFHDGTFSSYRGRDHGVPIDTAAMPSWRLVVCAQNHDQVGNRAVGDRIVDSLDDDQLACAALLTLAGPFTPMLFQGEEWAASTPFQFFTSHEEPELAEATAQGPDRGVLAPGLGPDDRARPAGPGDVRALPLDWSELGEGRHARMLDVYRRLARLRRRCRS